MQQSTALMAPNVKKVSDLLFQNREQFARSLSKTIDPDKFLSVVVSTFQDNPDLHDCTQSSMVRFALQCARFDMMPGVRRLCYAIPYNNKGRKEVQWQLGYQGALELCWRSAELNKLAVRPVFEGDLFSHSFGLDERLDHTPQSDWWAKAWEDTKNQEKAWEHLTHVYAWAKLKNGEKVFVVMTKSQLAWHRDRYSKAAKIGPWVSNPIEMSQKTALIELANLLPASDVDRRLQAAVGLEKQAEADVPQTLDVPFTIQGLDETAEVPERKPHSTAHKLPNIGKFPEYPVDHSDVTMEALEWYLKVVKANIGKKGREKFQPQDDKHIYEIEKEIARRQGSQDSSHPTEQDAKAETDTEAEPNNDDMIEDARWGRIIQYLDDGHKEKAKVLSQVKSVMKIPSLAILEPHMRKPFMLSVESYAKRANVEIQWPE